MTARIQKLCVLAVGKTVRVRIGPTTTILGTVQQCEFSSWRKHKDRKIAQFDMTCLCGNVKKRRKFRVEKVPTSHKIIPVVEGVEI